MIKIVKRDDNEYQLLVDESVYATLRRRHGAVELVWAVYGPQPWPAAQQLVEGLLELAMIATELEMTNG